MTEAAQIRLTYIAGIRDDLSDYAETAKEKLGEALLDSASQAADTRVFSSRSISRVEMSAFPSLGW